MAAFLDACRFTPSAGGTTDWVVSAAVQGYMTPAQAGATNGRLYKYRAESADLTQWEIGEGAYTSGTTTLARTTVLFNSSGTTSKINFSAAPQVAVVAIKEDLISIEESNSFSAAQQAQARTNIGAALAPTTLTSALGADVALTTQNTVYTALSVSTGTTGTFLVTGYVTVVDPVGSAKFILRLSDGVSVFAAATGNSVTGTANLVIPISKIITNPAGGAVSLQVLNTTRNGGTILWNASGQGAGDTQLNAVRIA